MKFSKISLLAAALLTCVGFRASAQTASTKTPDKPKAIIPVLKVGGDIVERKGPFGFLDTDTSTLRDMTEAVHHAAEDPDVVALVVHFDQPGWGLAQALDFHEAMKDFRKTDKPLYVYSDNMTIGTYTVATAATEIIQPPVGGLDIYGMNFSLYFFKDLLAKVGVTGDVVNTGPFKDAMEPFVANEMGAGTRTQFTALLDDFFKTLTKTVAENRKITPEEASKLLTGGPYTSKDALAKKAIDRIAYLDDFTDGLNDQFKDKDVDIDYDYSAKPKKPEELPSLMTLIMGAAKESAKKPDSTPKIALVYALGNIVDGRSDQSNPFTQQNEIAGLDFIDLLDEVSEDKGVKAIVLRVDSPGGSAIASDLIWKRLQAFKEDGIPIVVSMSDLAASGGYYISMGADKIVAEPGTITGSIGVVGGKFSLGGTYDLLGVHKQSISIGENVDIYSESKNWDDREKAILNHMLDDVYDEFTRKAAQGRGKTQDEIKSMAEGRIWSGTAGKANGLVDEVGSLDRAIAIARELGKAPNAKVVDFPKELTIMEFIEKTLAGKPTVSTHARSPKAHVTASLLQTNALAQAAAAVIPPRHLQQALFVIDSLRDKPAITLMMPFAFDLN